MHPNDEASPPESMSSQRLDDLINSIIDEPENKSAWNEFRALAAQSSEPWHRLAEQQRLARQLGLEYQAAVAPAMTVDLPAGQAIPMRRQIDWTAPLRTYIGWAAAILIALGWLINARITPTTDGSTAVTYDVADDGTLLGQYLAQPHVLGELPARLYEVQAGEDGQVVTIVRQILERRSMQMFDLAVKDGLNPVLRPTSTDSERLASRF